jgi:hypothetical protein
MKVFASLRLYDNPNCIARLTDTEVAVTSEKKSIYILDLDDELAIIKVKTEISTVRKYRGIAASNVDDSLIVSCWKSREGPALVDVISRTGQVMKTIVSSVSLRGLSRPDYLCASGNRLIISDWRPNAVYVVDASSGDILDMLHHDHLKYPHQVCTDVYGNIYIASTEDHTVLVRSPSGEWKRLLEADKHSETGFNRTAAVCVTKDGKLFVVWNVGPLYRSKVIGYQL